MKFKSAKLITIAFLILFLGGCASFMKYLAADRSKTEDSFPENRYFYFTESQILRNRGNTGLAIEHMKRAVDLDPESLFLKGELVNLYLQEKENEKALAIVEEIIKKDPGNVGALIMFGRIKHSLKQTDDAKMAYEKIIAESPKQQNIYLLLGSLYIEEGNLVKAIAVFEKLITNFPDFYLGYFYLGKIQGQKRNYAEAEKYFHKSIELKPDLDEAQYELVNLYKIQGKKKKIIQILNEMLGKNPGNIRAALELGYYYKINGIHDEARKIFYNLGEKSLSNFDIIINIIQFFLDKRDYIGTITIVEEMLKGAPESSDLHHIAGLAFFSLKQEDTALKHFLKVKNDSRFYSDAAVHVSLMYQSRGMLNDAVAYIKNVIEKDPDNPEYQYYLGLFYEELEEFDNAEEAFLKAIEMDPDDSRIHFRLGVVYDKDGNKEKSIEQMKTVIRIDPKNSNALNYLGYTYADSGENLDEAERLIVEALKYKPDDGYITDSLGWVFFKKGLYSKAVEFLKKAAAIVVDDPVILEHLGDAYLKLNDREKALESYNRALKFKKEERIILINKIKEIIN
ncbi:MAG: tetratricopeptide repeat protein [Proteobacteria bacterium]|nr:tetratricopeptide repeat protein [Pseudomonadota bacterium]MBU1571226.1 tetratricopeptide repeat protein [Pseudomonadota bacterium]